MNTPHWLSRPVKRTLALAFPILALLALALMPMAHVQAGWYTLVDELPEDAYLREVTISPDSQWVAYRLYSEKAMREELYSVPLDRSSGPIPLNPPLVNGGSVSSHVITPDSLRVIYIADQDVDDQFELYSVPIGGGKADKLNGPLVPGGDVLHFEIDAVTRQLVYQADQDIDDVWELYGLPFDGDGWKKINSPLAAGGTVLNFKVDPISARVVYNALKNPGGFYELFSAPLTGGQEVQLSQPLSANITSFALTPNAPYVLYVARESGSTEYELFVSLVAQAARQQRSVTLSPGDSVVNFRISPDGKQVVYNLSRSDNGFGDLFRTGAISGLSQQLTAGAATGNGVPGNVFTFTPDSRWVIFRYYHDKDKPGILQSARADGGPFVRSNIYIPDADHYLGQEAVSPNGEHLVYVTYHRTTELQEIFVIPPSGGEPTPLGVGSGVVISPDNQRLLYYYQEPSSMRGDLMSASMSGGDLRNLSQVADSEYVYEYLFSLDGKWIVYAVVDHSGKLKELRASDGTEFQPPTPTATLSPTPPSGSQGLNTYLPFLGK